MGKESLYQEYVDTLRSGVYEGACSLGAFAFIPSRDKFLSKPEKTAENVSETSFVSSGFYAFSYTHRSFCR